MKRDNNPTRPQLEALYTAADAFSQARLWNDFYDADLIAIRDPQSGEIHHCSIMGNGGEHFALGVYLGDSGLCGFYNILHGTQGRAILHEQDCIMCSFEDRELLTLPDYRQIKDLGLSYRGRNAWPMFRRYEPGYYPWYVTADECELLTTALVQITAAAKRIRTGQLTVDFDSARSILLESRPSKDGLTWHSEPYELHETRVGYRPLIMPDESFMKDVQNAKRQNGVILQLDVDYMPQPVQEDKSERPYFPRLLLVADKAEEMVLQYEVYPDVSEDAEQVINAMIAICLNHGRPEKIEIQSEAMFSILKDFCQKTQIGLEQVSDLAIVNGFLDGMASFE